MNASFNMTQMTVGNLVDQTANGSISLPDLQRPFVWPKSKVRDLFDSMYRGYPVGEIMFWLGRDEDEKTRSISGVENPAMQYSIIDGQQRLTSLFSVIRRHEVRDADYQKRRITIAFQPFEGKFEVSNASIERNPQWVPDISSIFDDPYAAQDNFFERWELANPEGSLSSEQQKMVRRAFAEVHGLLKYQFSVVTLLETTSKETVADIFVRINSEGVSLVASDFILTWLSVFWSEGREAIERFARLSRVTTARASEIEETKIDWTPFNHFLRVNAGQVVRLLVAIGQNRGPLIDAYSALQAKNKDGGADVALQNQELEKLKAALPIVTNKLHWDEFWKAIQLGGFRSGRMTTSNSNLLYSYVMFLIGRERFKVDLPVLRRAIARWFFMCQLTGRFTASPESRIQRELDALGDLPDTSQQAFLDYIDRVIANELSDDFWSLRMPEAMVSSAAAISPSFQCYLGALNILGADLFMISMKVHDWMDPTTSTQKGTELHHLFPRAFLEREYGITDVRRRNQIANFAPTDWKTNQTISDKPPYEYWDDLVKKQMRVPAMLEAQQFWHALPDNWQNLGYNEFLEKRRQLIAQVTRKGFETIGSGLFEPISNQSSFVEPAGEVRLPSDISELFELGIIKPGNVLVESETESGIETTVTEDLHVVINGHVFDDINEACAYLGAENINGADFWGVHLDDRVQSIRQIADSS